ncbi:hypothetical protein DYB26_014990 [Aphanomyces astaci]|uniref:Uncharacterized protein n=2 Tax=Aphanomyces astaci TaxID=112090 RepID=A0A3R7FAT2_APHAT|nr:hypothetical protein DYB26_014990 [Aphanomyces astaci]
MKDVRREEHILTSMHMITFMKLHYKDWLRTCVRAKSIIPFHHDLLTFMKDVRREEHILTSMHMITFMKLHYKDWLRTCTAAKPDPYKSLLRLCQGFAKRYNFSQRVPTHTKLAELEMTRISDEFSATPWRTFSMLMRLPSTTLCCLERSGLRSASQLKWTSPKSIPTGLQHVVRTV